MKADIRVRRTKNQIQNTFFRLLGEKDFSEITVTELCQMAEINRTTFYKHYFDMNDLLEKIENDILVQTQEQWKNLHPKNTVDGMEKILSNLRNDRLRDIANIFRADPLFSFQISEYICQCVIPNFNDTSYSPQEQSMIQRIMIYGYGSVTRNWLLSSKDDKMSARQLAEFLFELTEKITDSKR